MRVIATLIVILFATAEMYAGAAAAFRAGVDVSYSEEATIESNESDTTQNTNVANKQQGGALTVYLVDNEIRMTDVPDGATLYIYAITGARVGAYTVHENRVIMDKTLSKGIYIVRVNNRATKITIR